MIIKTDAIGDYILFRNFIELVKLSKIFKDYQIDLLGNKVWQDIALQYDKPFVTQFLFITPDDLYHEPLTTFKLGWTLFKNNYQAVLHPTYARTLIADGLAGLTAAKQIIGFEGDTERINLKLKFQTDRFYTDMFSLPGIITSEFERSKFFFENVLGRIVINGPFINVETGTRRGIIIFPGAGLFNRNWEPEKFLALIKKIREHTGQRIYLAGGADELSIGDYLIENLPAGSVVNIIAKTSLPQLIEIIGGASLVITNETSAVHIAAATGTPSVCILGGGHFGRFAPYPQAIPIKPVCVYEKMECYNCNWACIFKPAETAPFPCISNISLEQVWQAVLPLLPSYTKAIAGLETKINTI